MVNHFDYKHKCLIQNNVPMAFILPSRWQDGAESLGIEHTSCLCFGVIKEEGKKPYWTIGNQLRKSHKYNWKLIDYVFCSADMVLCLLLLKNSMTGQHDVLLSLNNFLGIQQHFWTIQTVKTRDQSYGHILSTELTFLLMKPHLTEPELQHQIVRVNRSKKASCSR